MSPSGLWAPKMSDGQFDYLREDRNPYFQGLITGLESLVAIIALDQLVNQKTGEQFVANAAA
jgi:hypothetical protein